MTNYLALSFPADPYVAKYPALDEYLANIYYHEPNATLDAIHKAGSLGEVRLILEFYDAFFDDENGPSRELVLFNLNQHDPVWAAFSKKYQYE
jgi:hypothetical protein